jgi:solute carrier family 66, member 2
MSNFQLISYPRTLTMTFPSWLSTAASVGMAVGPPLVYADQSVSMVRKKCVSFVSPVCGNIFTDHDTETQRVSRVMSALFCWFTFYKRDQICLSFVHLRLIANITRCFFWLGNRFEFALLLQSILMILAQVIVSSKIYTQTGD